MSSFLLDGLTTTEALADVFSDQSVLQAMLRVESALAHAEARSGLIPAHAADAIAGCARPDLFDAAAIARDARQSGTATIPFVKALTARVQLEDPAAAVFVHWGATSQDIADSALMLLLGRAVEVVRRDHSRLQETLRSLSEAHAQTLMLARTLLQPAPPITFGLKVAGWSAALDRGWTRLSDACRDGLMLQFGGASGTLAALGTDGLIVARALASALELGYPEAPWHTHRDRLAAILTSCGIYTATLGKIARDISLLMQNEVGEARERGGGSSTMPHKRNPAGCAIVLAAATRVPGLVSTFLSGMVQEHERAVGGWHAEWPVTASIVQSTGAALAAMADVIEGLTVYPAAMLRNLDAMNGTIFAERATMLLAPALGRDAAQRVIQETLTRVEASGRSFGDVLREHQDVRGVLPQDVLDTLDRPEHYLGVTETLRRQLLPAAPPVRIG
jgi:3-carboxy-cis,cis-muconate cycloisomerase